MIFYNFMLDFYPYLHKSSLLLHTKDKLVVFPGIIDSILGLLLGWKSQSSKTSRLHQNVRDYILGLQVEEQTAIVEHLQKVISLSEQGIDESQSPDCSLLQTQVLDFALKQCLLILKNFE